MSTIQNKKDLVITFKATKDFKEKVKRKAGQLGISVAEYLTNNIEESINKDINIEKGFSKVEDKMIDQFINLMDKFEDLKAEIKDGKHDEIKGLLTKDKRILTEVIIDKTKKEDYRLGDLLYIGNEKVYVVEAILEEQYLGLRNIFNDQTSRLNTSKNGNEFIKIKRLS